MAKSRAAKRRANGNSRAERRATSPSIDTDKSLKNAQPPQLPGANILRHSTTTSSRSRGTAIPAAASGGGRNGSGAGTGAGITKTSSRKRLSRAQRVRAEASWSRADAVKEQLRNRLEGSRRKSKAVKDRSNTWDEINNKISKENTRPEQKHTDKVLELENVVESVVDGGEWVDAEDVGSEEEKEVLQGLEKVKVSDLKAPPEAAGRQGPAEGEEEEEEEDMIL